MGRQVSSNRKSFNEGGLVSIRAKTWVGIPSSAGPAGVHRPIQSPATHASSVHAIWHNFAQCERASESRVQLTAGLRTAPYEPEKFYHDKKAKCDFIRYDIRTLRTNSILCIDF